jgi:hypothetical protein
MAQAGQKIPLDVVVISLQGHRIVPVQGVQGPKAGSAL